MQNEFIDEEIEIVIHSHDFDYQSRDEAISEGTLAKRTFIKTCIVILTVCSCVFGATAFLFNDQQSIIKNENERKLQGSPITSPLLLDAIPMPTESVQALRDTLEDQDMDETRDIIDEFEREELDQIIVDYNVYLKQRWAGLGGVEQIAQGYEECYNINGEITKKSYDEYLQARHGEQFKGFTLREAKIMQLLCIARKKLMRQRSSKRAVTPVRQEEKCKECQRMDQEQKGWLARKRKVVVPPSSPIKQQVKCDYRGKSEEAGCSLFGRNWFTAAPVRRPVHVPSK